MGLFFSVQLSSVTQSCLTICSPMESSTLGFTVHHQLNVHELGQTLGDSEGQGGLVCCSPQGHKESDTTEQLS